MVWIPRPEDERVLFIYFENVDFSFSYYFLDLLFLILFSSEPGLFYAAFLNYFTFQISRRMENPINSSVTNSILFQWTWKEVLIKR